MFTIHSGYGVGNEQISLETNISYTSGKLNRRAFQRFGHYWIALNQDIPSCTKHHSNKYLLLSQICYINIVFFE